MSIVSEEREQRQQWLNSLKVGDEVALYQHNHWNCHFKIATITKITPTRMMDADRYRFDSNGRERGRTYDGHKIVPATEEVKEKIARYKALSFIEHFEFKNLSTQQLLDVLKIIQGQ